jgi:hypothetical protein
LNEGRRFARHIRAAASFPVPEIFLGFVRRSRCPLIINGASEAWFGYRDQRDNLSSGLRAEANSAAGQIQAFLDNVRAQMDWTVQLPWLEGLDDRHRFDALRLLRQAPAITEVTLVDGKGIERLRLQSSAGVSAARAPREIMGIASVPWRLHRRGALGAWQNESGIPNR